jgi:hypothetical protein
MDVLAARRRRLLFLGLTLVFGCNNSDADHLAQLGRMAAAQADDWTNKPENKWTKGWQTLRAKPEETLDVRVSLRLRWDQVLAETPIQVKASDGVVELKGTLRDLSQRRRAVELAESTAGVQKVVDLLEVPSPKP